MAMIRVENLSFSYPSSYDPIFEHVSFQIDTDWKLGFIGRNGRGKTTFLQLLLGRYAYSGTITAPVPFDYFPYPVRDAACCTQELLPELCPEAEPWQFLRELTLLGVDEGALWRPFGTLSHGEQTKVLLAALFLRQGHFLLIDEPTNHLDAEARDKLAAYLKKKKGFILVSHDRRFLDGCVDHILSLNRADIEVQAGNFSSWWQNFNARQQAEAARSERLKKDIRALQTAARRTAAWSDRAEAAKYGSGPVDRGFVGHKAAKMMKRAKVIEARRQRALEEKAALLQNSEWVEDLKLSPLHYHSDTLAAFSNVAPVYDGCAVCAPVSFTVRRGQRIALAGRNGCGKSSVLKLLLGQPIAHSGEVTVASGLVISYVPQDASFLHGSLVDYAQQAGIDESLFKAILRKMGFARVQFEKPMQEQSAGQQKKILLARSLCERAHLYVWDEPLNYIDLYARMQIEALLRDFAPAMVFVEHDRAFRDAIATQVVEL